MSEFISFWITAGIPAFIAYEFGFIMSRRIQPAPYVTTEPADVGVIPCVCTVGRPSTRGCLQL